MEAVARTVKGHLPRLAPEFYRGHAFVHWTLTIEHRGTGWLTSQFHARWQLLLLHACSRYDLVCPGYVLMPDHMHVLLAGTSDRSDQRVAAEFIRTHARSFLAPFKWQQQSHDHVLLESERERDAFAAILSYIRANPVRAGLVRDWQDYPYAGISIPGYPDIDARTAGYWDLFWRIYNRMVGCR